MKYISLRVSLFGTTHLLKIVVSEVWHHSDLGILAPGRSCFMKIEEFKLNEELAKGIWDI